MIAVWLILPMLMKLEGSSSGSEQYLSLTALTKLTAAAIAQPFVHNERITIKSFAQSSLVVFIYILHTNMTSPL